MRILAIDPGPEQSGWALYDAPNVVNSGISETPDMLAIVADFSTQARYGDPAIIAIEMIASYGMPVGREVFETCVWIGRLMQAAEDPDEVRLVYRQDVKLHLCQSARAKDANIRQALIDRLGPPGTKKNPGGTYGVTSHAWAALAVAVTVADQMVAA